MIALVYRCLSCVCMSIWQSLILCLCIVVCNTWNISMCLCCRNLRYLDMIGLYKLTGHCLERVPELVPHLTYLDLTQCNSVCLHFILHSCFIVFSVLWHCWLGIRNNIRPVRTCGAGVVVILERGANDLHMVHLMPLPPRHLLLR